MADKIYGEDIMSDEEVIKTLEDIQKDFLDGERNTRYNLAIERAKKIVAVYHLMTLKELDL